MCVCQMKRVADAKIRKAFAFEEESNALNVCILNVWGNRTNNNKWQENVIINVSMMLFNMYIAFTCTIVFIFLPAHSHCIPYYVLYAVLIVHMTLKPLNP